MGVFSRINNMLKAKANNALDKAENPIELLDQKLKIWKMTYTMLNSLLLKYWEMFIFRRKKETSKSQMEDYEAKVKKLYPWEMKN